MKSHSQIYIKFLFYHTFFFKAFPFLILLFIYIQLFVDYFAINYYGILMNMSFEKNIVLQFDDNILEDS